MRASWVEALEAEGAAVVRELLAEVDCRRIEAALADVPTDRPGVRLAGRPDMAALLGNGGSVGRQVAAVLGAGTRPVRAVLFDKAPGNNWALGWHQDRTIVVQQRHDVDGYGPWTVKAGLVQVEPPFAVIAAMVTVRIHLDPVDDANAPLRIVPGSHRLGRLAEKEIPGICAQLGERDCLAARGDVWFYRTAIVHGSRAAAVPRRRRVLQIDYAADDLPLPLLWRGVE